MSKITIKEIQEWEKDFSKRKGLPPKDKSDSQQALIVSFLKLSEEVGELAEVILRKQYNQIQEEVADIVIFALKAAKIAEDYYDQSSLTSELIEKIKYSEERKYKKDSKDLDKPKESFNNWKSS